jgi:hypothetical protein
MNDFYTWLHPQIGIDQGPTGVGLKFKRIHGLIQPLLFTADTTQIDDNVSSWNGCG